MDYYQRKLPHWQPDGAEYFVTFRLAGSLPKTVVHQLKVFREQLRNNHELNWQPNLQKHIQRKIFRKYETLLNKAQIGPTWLRQKEIASIVQEAIHYRDIKKYVLYAYCIMPNHVHLVFRHLNMAYPNTKDVNKGHPVTKIMQNVKRYTARECNKLLKRQGAFWQSESFDRVIRSNEELQSTIRYVLNNPVKAQLVQYWKEWPYSYCKPEFAETFKFM